MVYYSGLKTTAIGFKIFLKKNTYYGSLKTTTIRFAMLRPIVVVWKQP